MPTIPLNLPERPDIFSFGFDRTLKRPISVDAVGKSVDDRYLEEQRVIHDPNGGHNHDGVNSRLIAAPTGRWIMLDPPWTQVLTLAGVSTQTNQTLDFSTYTTSRTKWVMMRVVILSSNATHATHIQFRRNGDTANELNAIFCYIDSTAGSDGSGDPRASQVITVATDSSQKLQYDILAEASSFTCRAWLLGYFETFP